MSRTQRKYDQEYKIQAVKLAKEIGGAKPLGTRMGSGKGAVDCWVAVVKPGRVMFEIAGVPEEDAREALRLAMHKLPCKCKIIAKADVEGGVTE